MKKECPSEYAYYQTPNPWLQVKLLKILQFFSYPSNPTHSKMLNDTLAKIIKKT